MKQRLETPFLSSFMNLNAQDDKEGVRSSDDDAKQQYEVLKDLVGALSKKL